MMAKRGLLIVGGGLTYITAVGVGYVYSRYNGDQKLGCSHVHLPDDERKAIYAKNAVKYDTQIGTDEILMGLNLLRWWNISRAKGHILEVILKALLVCKLHLI